MNINAILANNNVAIIELIKHADIVVRVIMALLLAASLCSWTIILDKFLTIGELNKKSALFEKNFWLNADPEELYHKIKNDISSHPSSDLFIAAMHEWDATNAAAIPTHKSGFREALRLRLENTIYVSINRSSDKATKGLNFLAITASSTPFIGLFGTVWGIMNSFQSIAISKNTGLDVVAPGIAEALLATAIGLFAAIPAVIFYNILNNKISRFIARLEDFGSELINLFSRELDREVK